jgi:predicted anti-sigma-YlaC factor YlaD
MITQEPNHSTYQEWLHLELDGELDGREKSMLARHVATCSRCRQERRELGVLERALGESRLQVHRDFRDKVMTELPAAGWETRSPKTWVAALAVVLLLALGAAALIGSASEQMQPALPLAAASLAIVELLRSSVLAGAGLLSASWKGLGLAFQELLGGSIWNTVAFGVLVLGLDVLLVRLVVRHRRLQRASQDSQEPRRQTGRS